MSFHPVWAGNSLFAPVFSISADSRVVEKVSQHVSLLRDKILVSPSFSGDARILRFEKPGDSFPSVEKIKRTCPISTNLIDGKVVTVIDDLFTDEEGDEFRKLICSKDFSVKGFSTPMAQKLGEEPCFSLLSKDLTELMSKPISSLNRLYALLGQIGEEMGAEISLQPLTINLPSGGKVESIVTNLLIDVSKESHKHGWHQDYTTDRGMHFQITKTNGRSYFPVDFVNGETGKPLLFSLILYVTNEKFSSDWGLGTVMRSEDGTLSTIQCKHMRVVLFQGDIFHSMEFSTEACPKDDPSWKRLSFVLKLMARPTAKSSADSLKSRFIQLFSPSLRDPSSFAPSDSVTSAAAEAQAAGAGATIP